MSFFKNIFGVVFLGMKGEGKAVRKFILRERKDTAIDVGEAPYRTPVP